MNKMPQTCDNRIQRVYCLGLRTGLACCMGQDHRTFENRFSYRMNKKLFILFKIITIYYYYRISFALLHLLLLVEL